MLYGGDIGGDATLEVWYANVTFGVPGSWTAGTGLEEGERRGHATVVYNDRVYIIGGENTGGTPAAFVEYAGAGLSSWTSDPLVIARIGHAAVAFNGFLYILGGDGDETSVKYTAIKEDGSLGASLFTGSNLPDTGRRYHSCVVVKNFIYLIGGQKGATSQDTVYFAEIKDDGSLGSWTETESLNKPSHNHASVVSGNSIFVIGGFNSIAPERLAVTQYAALAKAE